ncbi:MAG: PKD domain-containing protein [Bacteroidales bacterium]|nr:PKD domain-containing protein [Bacteroidales bacterium]
MKIAILYIFSLLIAFSPAWGQSTQPNSEKGFALFSIMQDTTAPNPFTYKFTDKSNGNIISWKWDFGDGKTSDKRQDTH